MALVVPLVAGRDASRGFLAVGERVSGAPFSEEDRDFAMTLGRQALAALESVRLHRVRLEKQRQDRELQIAREIQQSLFPSRAAGRARLRRRGAQPSRATRSAATTTTSSRCRAAGVALIVADVSGKGTPASLLMASRARVAARPRGQRCLRRS